MSSCTSAFSQISYGNCGVFLRESERFSLRMITNNLSGHPKLQSGNSKPVPITEYPTGILAASSGTAPSHAITGYKKVTELQNTTSIASLANHLSSWSPPSRTLAEKLSRALPAS